MPVICGCFEGEAEGKREEGGGLWTVAECHGTMAVLTEWTVWGSAVVCRHLLCSERIRLCYWREGWSPHAQTTSCPSASAQAGFGDDGLEKNLVVSTAM